VGTGVKGGDNCLKFGNLNDASSFRIYNSLTKTLVLLVKSQSVRGAFFYWPILYTSGLMLQDGHMTQ